MKKIMLILLSLGLIFSCGSKKDDMSSQNSGGAPKESAELKAEEGAVLKLWESKGKEADWIKYAAEEFEKKYGVKVQYENVEAPDVVKKLQTEGKTDSGAADLVVFPHDNIGQATSAGLLFSLDDLPELTKNLNDNFYPAAVSGAKGTDGKHYGIPLAMETYALFYNKDLLPEAPKSFEELIEKTKPLTDKSQQKFGIMFEPANFYFSYAFLSADGGYVFKDGVDANDIGLNNEGAVKGLEAMLKLKEISVDKAEDANGNVIKALFNEGKVAAVINGPWFLGDLKDTKINYGVVHLPTLNGKAPKSFSGVRILGINSTTKYPQAAALFMQFVTSKEMLAKRYEMTGQIPPLKDFVPSEEISKEFLAQISVSEPMPSIPEMGVVWAPMGAALGDAWAGKGAPKAVLDNAVKAIKEQIAATKTN